MPHFMLIQWVGMVRQTNNHKQSDSANKRVSDHDVHADINGVLESVRD